MTSVTALIVALTLAGSPGATLVCLGVCYDLSTTTGICHDRIAREALATVAAPAGACADLMTTSPFMKEEGRTTSAIASSGITAQQLSAPPVPPRPPFVHVWTRNDAPPISVLGLALRI